MIRHRIDPQSGTAFELRRGQILRVIDPQGEQVSDLMAYAKADPGEWLSSGRSIDYNDTILFTAGHALYSNRSRVMFRIVRDTVGRHDFLYTPCSRDTFALIYNHSGPHPSCFDNLTRSLEPYGIGADAIPTTFNIFMNVAIAPDGRVTRAAAAFNRRRLRRTAGRNGSDRRVDRLLCRDVQQLSLQADRLRNRSLVPGVSHPTGASKKNGGARL